MSGKNPVPLHNVHVNYSGAYTQPTITVIIPSMVPGLTALYQVKIILLACMLIPMSIAFHPLSFERVRYNFIYVHVTAAGTAVKSR